MPAMAVTDSSEENEALGSASPAGLSPIEVEVIDLFVSALRLLGLPKSLGEIYGLLFIAVRPLTLDDLVESLHLSKGSASQGLRTLRQLGAVKMTYVAGDRRDHYVAETELKQLVSGFLSGQVLPHLATGEARLERLRQVEKSLDPTRDPGTASVHRDRLKKLEQWHRRAQSFAPLIGKLLD